MVEQVDFSVPPELEPYIDDSLRRAHQQLRWQDARTVVRDMPPVQYLDREGTVGYVDLAPPMDHDRTHAVVLPLPFANGWAPHMALRARLLQDSLPTPTRCIVLPNNTRCEPRVYHLDQQARAKVRAGDFSPLAEQQVRTL